MIKANYVSSPSLEFYDFYGWAIARPSSSAPVSIPIETDDRLSERRGIFGENEVTHQKTEGTVSYDIEPLGWVSASTDQYPDKIIMPGSEYPNEGFLFGQAYAGRVSVIWDATLKIATYSAVRKLSGDNWIIRKFSVRKAYPTKLYGILYQYTMLSHSHTDYYETVIYDRTYWPVGDVGFDLFNASADQIFSLNPGTPVTKYGMTLSQKIHHCSVAESSLLTPSLLKSALRTLSASQIREISKPLEGEKHYGTLAAEAVDSMDLINVNMISFLSELRDPTSLIPKLRSLWQLKEAKTYADIFLSVKYGVLPTISDLQEIVAVFNKAKPYIDKNGFRSLTAGHTASEVISGVEITVEQHIKVALSNEFRGFLALSDGLDSLGMMPNLKNLWDLVPYSFALDWFIDVGDYLGQLDSKYRIDALDIKYVTGSRKVTRTIHLYPTPTLPLRGTVRWVHYHRWVTDHCPVPPLSLQAPENPSSHWLEGSALWIQRAKF